MKRRKFPRTRYLERVVRRWLWLRKHPKIHFFPDELTRENLRRIVLGSEYPEGKGPVLGGQVKIRVSLKESFSAKFAEAIGRYERGEFVGFPRRDSLPVLMQRPMLSDMFPRIDPFISKDDATEKCEEVLSFQDFLQRVLKKVSLSVAIPEAMLMESCEAAKHKIVSSKE